MGVSESRRKRRSENDGKEGEKKSSVRSTRTVASEEKISSAVRRETEERQRTVQSAAIQLLGVQVVVRGVLRRVPQPEFLCQRRCKNVVRFVFDRGEVRVRRFGQVSKADHVARLGVVEKIGLQEKF